MRAVGWIVVGGIAAVLGTAASLGVALRLHLLQSEDVETQRAWVEASGKECLVERRFERPGSTIWYHSLHEVKKVWAQEVEYDSGVLSMRRYFAARGNEEDRPDVAFKKDSNVLTTIEAGWPFRCLQQREWSLHSGCFARSVASEGRIEWDPANYVTVPGKPIWAGMTGNSVVWGSPWMAGFLFVGWMRKARRRRRGLCVACGYSMRGLESGTCCPECGRG